MGCFKTSAHGDSTEQPAAVHDVPIAAQHGDPEKNAEVLRNDGSSSQVPIDQEMEKRIVRKLDRHVVPLVMALCKVPLVSTLITGDLTDL